ncbi:MAG: TonB-dependent receptor [Candidatus Eisenbacteria bacterium]|nr:TonB-dependent receptor [Candidatus Eisenbacteria bacterium]
MATTTGTRFFSSSPLDWALVALYVAFLAAVWMARGRRAAGAVEYLLAGRRVTLPAFVATLVATWYGGILGVGEYSYRYGVSNWLVFGVPYYIGALLFAWVFARRARRAELYTLPDLLDRAYGRGPALIGAATVFLIAAPSAYVLMLGTLFAAMTGFALVPCTIAAALLSLFYIYRGGLRTVVFTDQVQFVLMFAGFFLIVGFLVAQHGGLGFLRASLPASHWTWHGGNPPQAVLVWYFIALSALVDPAFWQRAYAARDPEVARRGVLISIGCWIVFDFLTTTTGLYARAILPHIADPVFAYPELARVTLPPFALGIFYLAMIATVMSTIDSYGFIAASTIGRDVIWRLRGVADESRLTRDTRLGLVIATAFATMLALANPTVVGIWHDVGSITTPALLFPVATALLGRARIGARLTSSAMVAAFAAALTWELAKILQPAGAGYPLGIEPIYAGLATSLACYAAGWIAGARAGAARTIAPLAAGALLVTMLAAPFAAADEAPAAGAARRDSIAAHAAPETLARIVPLPEVVVSTARPDARAPVVRSILDRAAIAERNWGQDTPMALATLPDAYAYSDAGNGIGYSYLSIRGFPQRRISVLINGVPLNDPESHEVYWIDHPDLLSSTSEVQVQRGVGSALYGSASLGGSVDVETGPIAAAPFANATVGYGSYATRRIMFESGSGLLAGGWSVYGRYSRIETDGYRDRSWTRLWSYAISAARVIGGHTFKLNLYGGPETTHLAYLGVSSDYLDGLVTGDADRDRRFNPLTYPGEADHFFEPHYELIHAWHARDLAFTQTLFYFDGQGYYDEQRLLEPLAAYGLASWTTLDPTLFGADSLAHYRDADHDGVLDRDAQGRVTVDNADIVRRRWIADRHFGWIPRLRVAHAGGALTVGGELRWHDGHHIGTVITGNGLPPMIDPDHVYYDFHPRTFSGGVFAREEWRLSSALAATVDLGYRHQDYTMTGDRLGGIRFAQPYDLATPRLGLAWDAGGDWRAFAAAAHARREPALRDLYDGEGVGNPPLLVNGRPLVRPERVNDWELGGAWHHGVHAVTANLFRMDFHDELVYAGQFNTDLGYPILGNAAQSVHQGFELEASTAFGPGAMGAEGGASREHVASSRLAVRLAGNLTVSDNHFVRYREIDGLAAGDTIVYDGKAIGFFPATLANLSASLGWRGASLGADLQHVGRQYLDNTEDRSGSIAPHVVLNLRGGYRIARADGPAVEVSLRVFNALDRRYATSGYSYIDTGVRYTDFIPAATRNVLGEVRLGF